MWSLLHAFGYLDAEEAHTVPDNLGNVLGQHEAHGLLLLVGFVEDRIIVIELVEHLCQFVALVGDARGRVVLACLLNSSTELVHFLNEFHFFFIEATTHSYIPRFHRISFP